MTEEQTEQRTVQWKCRGCDTIKAATYSNFMSLNRHKCTGQKDVKLVDQNTDEDLATSWQDAKSKGYVTDESGSGRGGGGDQLGGDNNPRISSDGMFEYSIVLPADAFVLFNLAKAFNLEQDGDKPFDEWVWDCVRRRFDTDYKMQLILAPTEG